VTKIPQVVDDALQCLAREPRKDGIDLILDLDSLTAADGQPNVGISSVAIQQILVNLILNACRAMRQQRGGQLTICGTIASDTKSVELVVTDTGPGVPQSVRDRLFEPFVTEKVDPTPDSREPAGTGLGLSICRDLVDQAGGQIQLDPAPTTAQTNSGATFRIYLPIAVAS